MVEYQEHHLGGGGCLIPEAMVGMVMVRTDLLQVAFDEGDRDPASLVVRREAVSATGKIHSTFSESVVGVGVGCGIRLCRIG